MVCDFYHFWYRWRGGFVPTSTVQYNHPSGLREIWELKPWRPISRWTDWKLKATWKEQGGIIHLNCQKTLSIHRFDVDGKLIHQNALWAGCNWRESACLTNCGGETNSKHYFKTAHLKEKKIQYCLLRQECRREERKSENILSTSAITRNDVAALWSSDSIYSCHSVIADQSSFISQPCQESDFTPFGNTEGEKLVYVSHTNSRTTKRLVWKEMDHVCINSCIVFHFDLCLNTLVCISYP